MREDNTRLLTLFKFELKFLEDGGYGRSPRTPWRPSLAFEDSPSCLNFDDPARPEPCDQCWLMQFVPEERKSESSPCRFIPLTDRGETIDSFYRGGAQIELEETLAAWLRKQIARIEGQSADREKLVAVDPEDEYSKMAET